MVLGSMVAVLAEGKLRAGNLHYTNAPPHFQVLVYRMDRQVSYKTVLENCDTVYVESNSVHCKLVLVVNNVVQRNHVFLVWFLSNFDSSQNFDFVALHLIFDSLNSIAYFDHKTLKL